MLLSAASSWTDRLPMLLVDNDAGRFVDFTEEPLESLGHVQQTSNLLSEDAEPSRLFNIANSNEANLDLQTL